MLLYRPFGRHHDMPGLTLADILIQPSAKPENDFNATSSAEEMTGSGPEVRGLAERCSAARVAFSKTGSPLSIALPWTPIELPFADGERTFENSAQSNPTAQGQVASWET